MKNYYSTLGLSRTATHDELKSAYYKLAKEFHPDRHQNEDDASITDYAVKMSSVSEAYEILSNEITRRRYDLFLDGGATETSATEFSVRRPNISECMFCAHHPVTTETLRRNVGLLFMHKYGKFQIRACRGCGLNLAREMQNMTLLQGWYGFISFFANLGAVYGNAQAIRNFDKLDNPIPPADSVARPIAEPSHQGKTIFSRAGVYVSAVVFVFVGASIANGNKISNTSSSAVVQKTGWATGDCVNVNNSRVTYVSCSKAHNGEVTDIILTKEMCPTGSTSYIKNNSNDPALVARIICLLEY